MSDKLIISLTSYPARINTVNQVIESLLNQTVQADKIILWLAEEEFPNKEADLPQELLNLLNNNITFCIKWCENIKPYKKLIPSIKEFSNSIIITFDDDIIYDSDCVKSLYDTHLKFPNDIIGNRGHYITFNISRKINPYKQWIRETTHKRASFNCVLTGVGGVLYPPNCFYKDILDRNLFETLAYNTDDLWFWAMGVLNGTKFRVCRKSPMKLNYIENTQSSALYIQNGQMGNNNDKNLENLFNKYPKLYKKLTKYYPIEKNLYKVFSVTNSGVHKVITIFGIKLKIKSKKLIERERFDSINRKFNNLNKLTRELKDENYNLYKLSERYNICNQEILKFQNKIYNQVKIKNENKILSFRTVQNLSDLIRNKISILPADIDLVVGIPRSGVIPAFLIALFLNKKVCTINEFIHNLEPLNGSTRPVRENEIKNKKQKVLIVDDSIYSGKSMEDAKNLISAHKNLDEYDIQYCAIFAKKESVDLVDYYFEVVNPPRVFQWNYLNHSNATKSCYDMDGVLCVDPTDEQNDDGEKYIDFCKNAKPLYIPSYKINSIVTSRLEKYREVTEQWLSEHHVNYGKLYMLDLPSAEERRRLGCHAEFKADIFKTLDDCDFFIESNREQAQKIAELSGKQCICVATDEYFGG